MGAVPLFVAYAIHRRVPGWRFFRATVFLPAVYATVVIGILTATVLQLDGPLNSALGAVGLDSLQREWLGPGMSASPAANRGSVGGSGRPSRLTIARPGPDLAKLV